VFNAIFKDDGTLDGNGVERAEEDNLTRQRRKGWYYAEWPCLQYVRGEVLGPPQSGGRGTLVYLRMARVIAESRFDITARLEQPSGPSPLPEGAKAPA
jgi:hypothetical protein